MNFRTFFRIFRGQIVIWGQVQMRGHHKEHTHNEHRGFLS